MKSKPRLEIKIFRVTVSLVSAEPEKVVRNQVPRFLKLDVFVSLPVQEKVSSQIRPCSVT